MTISTDFLEQLQVFEGYSPRAYLCPAGKLTIGYGHTGPDVHPGQVISIDRATDLLRQDVADAERTVSEATRMCRLTQRQFDALVSFTYNVGAGNFLRSTLLNTVKANPNNRDIRAQFLRWNKSGGRVIAGLSKRRETEANWYFS